jgi:hypothetical protein
MKALRLALAEKKNKIQQKNLSLKVMSFDDFAKSDIKLKK